jgi:hypothetical protein
MGVPIKVSFLAVFACEVGLEEHPNVSSAFPLARLQQFYFFSPSQATFRIKDEKRQYRQRAGDLLTSSVPSSYLRL